MYFAYFFRRVPIRWIVFILVLWNNSSYSPTVKNVVFYLNDQSLKQPYHGDSVHFMILLASLLGIIPLIVYLTECYKRNISGDVFAFRTFRLALRFFYTGFLFLLGVIEVMKRCITELRPHFLTSCMPDVIEVSSSGLVTNFTCSGISQDTLLGRDLYKSFPSGHAALAVYAFVFFNIYLYKRLTPQHRTRKYTLLLRSISALTFIWTLTCCITRILDNRHFWWDVLAGIALGIVAGMISIRELFRKITALPGENS